jgi:hypothetical protein
MIGPPGSGKSMLARRLPSILPPLEPAEMLEVSMIRSLAGDLAGGGISGNRPFRAPHHSASMAALVGGGTRPRPGEAALAHLGVLFLDELPEFNPQVLDALRQPLETPGDGGPNPRGRGPELSRRDLAPGQSGRLTRPFEAPSSKGFSKRHPCPPLGPNPPALSPACHIAF